MTYHGTYDGIHIKSFPSISGKVPTKMHSNFSEKSYKFPGCVQQTSASMKVRVSFTVCKVKCLSIINSSSLSPYTLFLRQGNYCQLEVPPLAPEKERKLNRKRELPTRQVSGLGYLTSSWEGKDAQSYGTSWWTEPISFSVVVGCSATGCPKSLSMP